MVKWLKLYKNAAKQIPSMLIDLIDVYRFKLDPRTCFTSGQQVVMSVGMDDLANAWHPTSATTSMTSLVCNDSCANRSFLEANITAEPPSEELVS